MRNDWIGSQPGSVGVIASTLLLCGLSFLQAAEEPARAAYRSDRILVMPKEATAPANIWQFHTGQGARVLQQFDQLAGIQVVQLPPGLEPNTAQERYGKSGLFALVELDYRVSLTLDPNDPHYTGGTLWHLHNTGQSGGADDADIDAPEGWDTTRNAEAIVVAIVDSGIWHSHEDLAGNMWRNPNEIPGNGVDDDGNGLVDDVHGLNAAADDGNPVDRLGHGTQVAGVAGAVGNNGVGITGVAWQIQLMACRFYDDAGSGFISDAIQAMEYARQHGAHIINASWVVDAFSSTLERAIDECRRDGILFVTASGNNGSNNDTAPLYPANYDLDNIVTATATTRTDALWSSANYGAFSVDLAAPGAGLTTTQTGNNTAYVSINGTSFAAPQVAGALALLKTRYPSDSYQQLIDRLLSTVDPLPSLEGKCVTGGRLNLANALGPSIGASFTAIPTSGSPPLDVRFTDTSFGAIAEWHWDFGDGTTSMAQNPTHRYESEGAFLVELTVRNDLGISSAASQVISVVANYKISNTSFSWIDPNQMAVIALADDGVSAALPLPFPFNFYGRDYEQLFVGANGLIGFESSGLNTAANTDLPLAGAPNNIISPFWDDLNPAAGGSVRWGTVGSAPNRRFVVSWANVPHTSRPPATFTFQVILEEATHRIVFQYLSVVPGRGSADQGRSATVGVENDSGTLAARYSFDGSQLLADQTALALLPPTILEPPNPGILEVLPVNALLFTGFPGGPFLPSSFDYILTNTGESTLQWSVQPQHDWLVFTSTQGSLAPEQSVHVTVTLHESALTFPVGDYDDTLTWMNETTSQDNQPRLVGLGIDRLSVRLARQFSPELHRITLLGPSGHPCQVQVSTNLVDWEVIAQGILGTDGTFTYEEPALDQETHRYYRGMVP